MTFIDYINVIHELSNKEIGILFPYNLEIYSSNTFKLNYNINVINHNPYNTLIDFKELKYKEIVIWNSLFIFIYKKSNNGYELIQTIDENEQETNKNNKRRIKEHYYRLNSIYQLKNGILVSCNSYGLKFYKKEKNEYILESKYNTEYDAKNIIEIKEKF